MLLDSMLVRTAEGAVTAGSLLLCTAASLILGLICALVYMHRHTYTKSFVITLALLPVTVQAIIMLVNGNLGTGVAIMGAFGLVRFRSVPGTAREIGSIFIAMAVGLATGMGYIVFAALFMVIVGGAMLLLNMSRFGEPSATERDLKISIPENLDYEGMFDDLFQTYTNGAELLRVRTTNMGSLYELTFRIQLKGATIQKEFLDQLRCRNGNLTIQCGRPANGNDAL